MPSNDTIFSSVNPKFDTITIFKDGEKLKISPKKAIRDFLGVELVVSVYINDDVRFTAVF